MKDVESDTIRIIESFVENSDKRIKNFEIMKATEKETIENMRIIERNIVENMKTLKEETIERIRIIEEMKAADIEESSEWNSNLSILFSWI